MCGVVGFSGKPSTTARIMFSRLAEESIVRGMHAFGFGYVERDGVRLEKSLHLPELLYKLPNKLPARTVFHARYSTSGDYTCTVNNQPLAVEGSCLVFNGTLDMGTKQEMEAAHGVKLISENDGELALLAGLRGELLKFVQSSHGSFAGIMLSRGKLYAIRNYRRPLWQWRSSAGVFFASTKDIFLRADIGADPEEIQPNTLVEV